MTVPLLPGTVLLHILMEPEYRSTISLQIHNPSPVPTSFLVVKNGSKIRARTWLGMPDPESGSFRRTPLLTEPFLLTAHTLIRSRPPFSTASMLLPHTSPTT